MAKDLISLGADVWIQDKVTAFEERVSEREESTPFIEPISQTGRTPIDWAIVLNDHAVVEVRKSEERN